MYEALGNITLPNEFNLVDAINKLPDEQVKSSLRSMVGGIYAAAIPEFRDAFSMAKEWLVDANWDYNVSDRQFDPARFAQHQQILALSDGGRDEIISTRVNLLDMRNAWIDAETKDRFPFQSSMPILNEVTRGGMMRGETALIVMGSGDWQDHQPHQPCLAVCTARTILPLHSAGRARRQDLPAPGVQSLEHSVRGNAPANR